MPRSPIAAIVAAILVLPILALPARADVPDAEPLVAVVEAFGMTCEHETLPDVEQNQCSTPYDPGRVRTITAQIHRSADGLFVGVQRVSEDGGIAPVETDVVDLIAELISLGVEDQSVEDEALAWLTEMNQGPQAEGSLDAGNSRFTWAVQPWTVVGDGSALEFSGELRESSSGAPPTSTDGGGSGAPTACLTEDVEAAIEAYTGGDLTTDPSPDAVADALAALELSGSSAEARDALVSALSSDPIDETSLVFGALRFQSEVRIDCSAAPEPSFGVPRLAAGERATSSVGVWTYQGSWTLVSSVNDAGMESDPPIGTTREGTLTIRCSEHLVCTVASDGGEVFDRPFDVVEPGLLSSVRARDPGDCPDEVETHRIDVEHGPDRAVATSAIFTVPRSCAKGDGEHSSFDYTWVFDGLLTSHVGPDDSDGNGDPTDPVGVPAAPTAGRPFADAVPAVNEISTDPIVLLQSALLAALVVFLMPFPSQLFNSTLETHEDEVRRWFRLDRLGAVGAGVGAFWASWPGVALFTGLAALLYGFLDPGFGISLGSLATFVGMLLGIVLVTAAFAVPAVLAHRGIGAGWTPKVVPLSLLIGVACVLLSRVTGFQPGYLYGLLIGLAFAAELSAAEEGRATALGAIAMLAVAFVAWLALGALPDGDGFGLVVARTALAALMVAGLEGVVFGLLPMRFLPGESLYAWNRVAWGALLAIGAFAFFHILINPASGYLSDTSRTPLFTVLGLLIGFSLVSVAFWAWFRYRDHPAEPLAPASTD